MAKYHLSNHNKYLPTLISVIFFYCMLYCFSRLSAQPVNPINNGTVLQKIDSLLEAKYVLSNKAAKCAQQFRAKYQSGTYNRITDPRLFATQVTADLVEITQDKHILFRVIESSEAGEKTQSSLHHPVRYHLLGKKENEGFTRLEWIEGNIGYLDFRRFYYFSDVRETADAAMKFLAGANAIIIDLRENGGGSGDYLSSYFLPYPTQLNSWYSREDDFLTQFWTTANIGIEPITDIPLFLLTSDRTFSAAESFAYDLQVRKRAVVVGDSTKGGAHSVDLYTIDDQFEIYIPTARAVNPITGTNWEGNGVIPDILVPEECALDSTILLARDAGKIIAKQQDEKLKAAVVTMQFYMDRAEGLFRKNKTEKALVALDSLFVIASAHGFTSEFFMDVLAYNYQAQSDENILYAILNKKIELFPESPGAYESLAYACYKNSRKEQAIKNFKQVLRLDPNNHNAREMIKRIQNE